MIRRYWQTIMIGLARSERLKTFMQANKGMTSLATRYVGGRTADEAIDTAKILASRNILSSLFYLGEYVNTDELVRENVDAIEEVISYLAGTDLDLHVSVDPTQVGCSIDWNKGCEEIKKIGDQICLETRDREGVHCLMLDMEDYSVNEKTISLHDSLRSNGIPMAQTLQAYLKKTCKDMEIMINHGAKVRLVKGAFAAGSDIAYSGDKAIRESYIRLIDLMLSPQARESGFYPIFGTHDDKLHDYAIAKARQNGWSQGEYEFEMLYGARPDITQALADQGERVRLYLPFGKDWWPYAVRRIGENPKNALLLARSIF